jgi:hypothetical protein
MGGGVRQEEKRWPFEALGKPFEALGKPFEALGKPFEALGKQAPRSSLRSPLRSSG